MNSFNISGIIGYAILKNPENNKLTFLLADVHDGVEYCKENHIFIDTLLNKLLLKNNIKILLEEVPRDNLQLVELWPDAEHTQRLKKWYLNNQKDIIPIDIRPFLIPFSHQKYNLGLLSIEEKNLKMNNYLITLKSLFFLNDKPLDNSIIFFKNILYFLNNKSSQKGICGMYKMLKEKFVSLINKINLDDTFYELINKDLKWFEDLEDLKLNIMDWYTSLMLLDNNYNICHFGAAHFLNVKEILTNNFNFKIINENMNDDITSSCVKVN